VPLTSPITSKSRFFINIYRNNKAVGFMKEGHIFTIEPMINQGTYKDILWNDDWTAVTADG